MNKNRRFKCSGFLFGALLLLIFLFSHFDLVFSQWENAEITRLTENVSLNGMLSLIIGKDDKLFLLYIEYPPGLYGGRYQTLLMTKEKGKEWSEPEEIGDTCYSSVSRCPIFYIDPQTEVIHLLYYDTDKIYYSNSQRQNWEKDLIDSGYTYSGKLAFDSLGNVHLSLGKQWVSAGEHYVKYYYLTNQSGEWVQQAISPDIFTGFGYVAVHWIGVEREGVAHIVYAGSYYYKHAWNNALGGTTWTTRYIPPPPGAYDSYWISSFGLDRSGRLHTTIHTYLYEPQRDRELYYPWVDDTGWAQPEEITDIGLMTESLFIDQDGEVHTVWSSFSGDVGTRDIYYSRRKQGEWTSYKILDHTERYSNMPFLFVIDSEGKGHAAFAGIYYDPVYVQDSTEIYYMVGSPTSAPEAEEREQVADFVLLQNYPNPFNTSTIIPFTVTRSEVNGSRFIVNSPTHTTQQSVNSSQLMVHSPLHTTLVIYNILGEKVRTLVDEEKPPGEYRVMWDGKDETGKEVASGVYFCKLKVGDFSQSRKLVLIK